MTKTTARTALTSAVLLGVSLVGAASAFAAPAAGTSASRPMLIERNGRMVRAEHTCGTSQTPGDVDPGGSTEPARALTEPQVVYLNKNGGTYTIGNAATSAATNTVKLNSSFNQAGPVTIPALDTTRFNWPGIVECVATAYKKYNVTVVETEPTSGLYVEAVVGGNDGTEIGRPGLFGIAATDRFCNLYQTGIAFNFAQTHLEAFRAGFENTEMCNTIAHEVGHVLGLEHEAWAKDHMSYDYIEDTTGCTATNACKSFVDGLHPCGTYEGSPRACSCAGASNGNINSHAKLANYLGLRPQEMVPPMLTIDGPDDILRLPPTFDVTVTATDNMAMQDVVVLIDGSQVGVDNMPDGTTYVVRATNVAEGDHVMIVRARDAALNMADETKNIRVVKFETGETCVDSSACRGDICANSATEGMFCTEACSVAAENDSCPDGFACSAINGGELEICTPAKDEDGGGCCSSTSGGSGAAGLLTLGVGLVLARRRRRAAA